ncbi:putative leucine-rich repeat receptor-like protein kinase [Heracleum sosnowskyi]|uniref:Leucine-rich repeat receptor-like protein kinase n=1 Tax=Heracleum sosnowskyi TaxID=360622 RepID=A0AAD8MR61_9APIA|nr:putative leucine-rich repeat receptor-like protein kinase [Heracleum sosnowskyi]
MKPLHVTLPLLFFHFSHLQALLNSDTQSLLSFKSSSDTLNKLTTWTNATDPCTWYGIYCLHNRVSRLVLENLELTGTFASLSSLTHLRVLSLKHNNLSGSLPDMSKFTSLRLVFLSHNKFSGEFPVFLSRLYRLDLSYNNLSGHIPDNVNNLTHILTLRLESNHFSGNLPEIYLINLRDFNISGNKLTGEIPESLSGFPPSAFYKNILLCGAPLQKCRNDLTRPGSVASPSSKPATNASSPKKELPISSGNIKNKSGSKISTLAIIAIVIGDFFVLVVFSLLLYCYFRRSSGENDGTGPGSRTGTGRVTKGKNVVYSSNPYPTGQPGFEGGRMVFFEGAKKFELEELLRASAEMLGKGGFGVAYKAVLDDGNVVAVKRLKEHGSNVGGKKEFEQQMEVLGKLRHENLVSFKAYYVAKDEKLLIYDYMPNGNLFWLLHGNRGPGRTPLDWTTRLKIAAGAANFGLSSFTPPSSVATRSNGYRAPESQTNNSRKLTEKSDVYSFGVLLLELLTGKCPSMAVDTDGYCDGVVDLPRWVQSVVREEWTAEVFDLELLRCKGVEEEMVGLLQIALTCTSESPDQRPSMSYVLKMIEEIRGVQVSSSHDSVSDSPAVGL